MLFFSLCATPFWVWDFAFFWAFFFFCWWDLEWFVSVRMQWLTLSQGPNSRQVLGRNLLLSWNENVFHLLFCWRLGLSSLTGIDFWFLWLNLDGKGWLHWDVKVLPCTSQNLLVSPQTGDPAWSWYSRDIIPHMSDLCHPVSLPPLLWRFLARRIVNWKLFVFLLSVGRTY